MLDAETIRRVPRFSGISPAAEEFLCNHAEQHTYQAGESIFMEGDESRWFYILLEGEVKIFKVLESGRELILNIFRMGEAFGEVALMDGSDFPANAVAQEDSTVLQLRRDHYYAMLETFPEVSRSIIRDLSIRVHGLRRRVEVLGESGVQSRIAHLMQVYSRQFGQTVEGGILIPVHLSRQELASLVCARIETVIRIMSRWQRENVVQTLPDGFLVPDLEALLRLTNSEN